MHFVEKPDEDKAARLIENGAYWNGGVFAFKLGTVLRIAKENVQFDDFTELHGKYGVSKKSALIIRSSKRQNAWLLHLTMASGQISERGKHSLMNCRKIHLEWSLRSVRTTLLS